jgi:argininosuccinate lyase
MALWGGRFAKDTDRKVAQFTASVAYDQRLYPYDIAGSQAHVTMLARAGIIPTADAEAIVAELDRIRLRLDQGELELKDELEDIHMNIESNLIEALGDVGARVHSGRSRNDQVATDERLYMRDEADRLRELLADMQRAMVTLARENESVILPGFTHLQHAQPVLLAHHLLAYVEMFERDRERFEDCRKRLNRLPLGAGALAGSTLPLDREFVAEQLGFDEVLRNSMDAVGDRDYIVEFMSSLAIVAMHCSRLAEDVILWMSQEFNFVELDDAFCTGSSLMPQKKNPDVAELTRGKTGRVYGSLMGILTVLKGLPLTYNRDLQEDKEGLFDAIDTVTMILGTMGPMLASAKVNAPRMSAAAADPELMATDLAEWLVGQNVPFRDAHRQVGRFVGYCRERGLKLNEVSLEQMRESVPLANEECLQLFSAERSVAGRDITGGTAPGQVARQLAFWEDRL